MLSWFKTFLSGELGGGGLGFLDSVVEEGGLGGCTIVALGDFMGESYFQVMPGLETQVETPLLEEEHSPSVRATVAQLGHLRLGPPGTDFYGYAYGYYGFINPHMHMEMTMIPVCIWRVTLIPICI